MSKSNKSIDHGQGRYSDGSDALYQRFFIQLQHLPTMQSVFFKAFLTQFEDQYTSEWQPEQLFGRMDPIRSFRGTQRMITLGWDVVAASLDEAAHNLTNCSTLLSMLYPSYDHSAKASPPNNNGTEQVKNKKAPGNLTTQKAEGDIKKSQKAGPKQSQGNASTIHSAPLFRIKFANLIQSTKGTDTPNTAIESGLVGTIDGLTYAPDLEAGFFDPKVAGTSVLYPQTIQLSFGFHVSHDHPLGWNTGAPAKLRAGNVFPYPSTAHPSKKK